MITCAAIQHPNGTIYCGLRHAELIEEIVSETNEWPSGMVFGFVDEEGNFFDRKYARQKAIQCSQYGMGQAQSATSQEILFSEDIY